jgi:hypothetical protein
VSGYAPPAIRRDRLRQPLSRGETEGRERQEGSGKAARWLT